MRLRSLLFSLLLLVSFAAAAHALQTTPTERAALARAKNDHSAYTLVPEKLQNAHALGRLRVLTHFGGALWTIVSLLLILQLGVAARMRTATLRLTRNRRAQAFAYSGQLLALVTLLDLPLAIFREHNARRYGLSVQSWAGWAADQAKSLALTYALGGLLVMLLFLTIRRFPRRWWLVFSLAGFGLTVIGIFLTPLIIDPLFNTFEPLSASNPALVAQLQKVVARGRGIDIPPERMFLMKASEKATTLNAYVTGFGGSKRVVVWDTSIAKGTPDEISFIFGHEMGHYVLGHIETGLAFTFVMILVSFYLGFRLEHLLLRRFGRRWGVPGQDDWAALPVLLLVLSVVSFFSEPIENSFSRQQEHAADVYGQEAVHGIIADPEATAQQAFQLLGESALADPAPSPLIELWTGSHPPIWLRAAFARAYDPWAAGAQPKYFAK